ncbi:Hypothetical protein AT6N2_L0403 [Agrobacterium tumefaciens]|nr:Hypothetical protein AT6N2_L0403 [Agrobacterium tumefaciens]
MGEDEGELAALDLFILRDRRHQRLDRRQFAGNILHCRWQPDSLQMRLDARGIVRAGEVEASGELVGQHHADGDAFAVHQPRAIVIGCRFQRVTEGMAEIQKGAHAIFLLVGHDNICLRLATRRNRLNASGAAGADFVPVLFQPEEEIRLVDQTVLDDFGVAGAELARTERIEHRRIGQDQIRLVKNTEKVLAVAAVDAGLATDGGIDLRQKRGRYLHEADAAAHNACRKTSEIADHAAAQRDHRIVALHACSENCIADRHEMLEALGLFTCRQGQRDGLDAIRLQSVHETFEIKRRDMLVRDDRRAFTLKPCRDFTACPADQSRPDQNVIRALAKRHVDETFIGMDFGRRHGGQSFCLKPAIAVSTSVAMISLRTSRDSMVMSASA